MKLSIPFTEGFLFEDEQTLEAIAAKFENADLPDREPENAGPDDDAFSRLLAEAKHVSTDGMFPPAAFTARRHYQVKD